MESISNGQNRPVCVFDSGIGGLNILAECAKKLPSFNFVYVADNYNVPYGNRAEGEIKRLVDDKFAYIASLNPSAAVIACNTATAVCVEELRKKYSFPIVGTQPAIKQAVKVGGNCLVLATVATAKSSSFINLVQKFGNADTKIMPCPNLADYIEQNLLAPQDFQPERYLPTLGADSVVIGCTHYIFVKKNIENFYRCPIFDGVLGIVDHLKDILGIVEDNSLIKPKISFYGGNADKNMKIFTTIYSGLAKCEK